MVNPGGVNPPHFSETNRLRVTLQRDKMPTLLGSTEDVIMGDRFRGVLLSETGNKAILPEVVRSGVGGLKSARATNQIVNSYPNADEKSLYRALL